MLDLVNKKFGKLLVIEKTNKRTKRGTIIWKCECDCGNVVYVGTSTLRTGHTKSCGCTRKEKFKEYSEKLKGNLVGQKFGKLTVIKNIESNMRGQSMWLCRCDCGQKIEVEGHSLRKGNTKSCGCISKEILRKETNTAYISSVLKNNTSKITKSGVKGVSWDKRKRKWRSYIMLKEKYEHLGYFKSLEKAIKARQKAEEELFKSFLEERKSK